MNTLHHFTPTLLRTSSNHCTAGNVRGQPAGVRIVLLGVSACLYWLKLIEIALKCTAIGLRNSISHNKLDATSQSPDVLQAWMEDK